MPLFKSQSRPVILLLILVFISCKMDTVIDSWEKEEPAEKEERSVPTYITDITQQLNHLDSVYQSNPYVRFSKKNLEKLVSIEQTIDTADMRGYEFLKVKALWLRGVQYSNTGVRNKEIEYYQKAEHLADKLPKTKTLLNDKAEIYNLLGIYYQNIAREYSLAIQYHQLHFEVAKQLNAPSEQAIAQTNLAEIYSSLNDFENAEIAFQKANKSWESSPLEISDSLNYLGFQYTLGKFYINQGRKQRISGAEQNARNYFHKAIGKYRNILKALEITSIPQIQFYKYRANQGMASSFLILDPYIFCDSIDYYTKQNRKLFTYDTYFTTETYGNQAIVNALRGNTEAALQSIDNGFKVYTRKEKYVYDEFLIAPTGMELHYLNLIYSRAKSLEFLGLKKNNLELLIQSVEEYKNTLNWIERLRNNYTSKVTQESVNDFYSLYGMHASALAFKIHEMNNDESYVELAFNISEKTKSFVLRNEASFFLKEETYTGEKKNLWKKEQQLKRDIFMNESLVLNNKKYRKSLIEARLAYRHFLEELERSHPSSVKYNYYLERLDEHIPAFDEIKKSIKKPDHAIIKFQMNRAYAGAFIIKKNGYHSLSIPLGSDFSGKLLRYSESLKSKTGGFQKEASELYDILFKPLENYLKGIKSITIVPAPSFKDLVFENLLTSPVLANEKWSDYSYLLKKYDIGYAYSIASNLALQKLYDSRPPTKFDLSMFSAFANGTNEHLDWGCGGGNDLNQIAEATVLASQQITANKKTYFPNASKADFLAHSTNSTISQLTLHGCFNTKNNTLENYLQFTPNDQDDGKFRIADFYGTRLNHRLLVLASCETGAGNVSNSEGVQSIARACLHAGCSSVVTAIDAVEDKSTAILMKYFYENIFEGQAINEALTNAKKQYLANPQTKGFRHPMYWANMICIGNTGKVF